MANEESPVRHESLWYSGLLWNLVLPVFDAAAFLALFSVLFSIRVGQSYLAFFNEQNLVAALVYIVCVLATVAVMGGYRARGTYRTLSFASEFILAVFVGAVIGTFLQYGVFSARDVVSQASRAVLVFSSIAFVPAGLSIRIALTAAREHGTGYHPYLVVGSARNIKEFAESYLGHSGLQNPLEYSVIGEDEFGVHSGVDLNPDTEIDRPNWNKALRKYEGIIICDVPGMLDERLLQTLVRAHFNIVPVFTMNSFYATMWRQVPTLNMNLAWTLEQDFSLAYRSYYQYVKRIFDVTLGLIILIVTLPLMVLIAIAVKLESRGPALFVQSRVGFEGHAFNLYKIRTMKEGSETGGSPYTAERDSRVTRVGAILRRLRLDEIPQVLNVLKGDMSLIGPRAEWDRLVAVYESAIPYYHLRHMVKPGLTGWAQLNYPYGSSVQDAVEKLKFDLYYIKHYSPILDLEIVLKTALSMISFKGR